MVPGFIHYVSDATFWISFILCNRIHMLCKWLHFYCFHIDVLFFIDPQRESVVHLIIWRLRRGFWIPLSCLCVAVLQVRQLERTVSLRDLSIVEMDGKMREMSAATYDGIFVWKISDFTKKRQDAVAGRAPAMFSPGKKNIDD